MLDFVVDEAVDIEETVIHAVMVDRLRAALSLLSDSEQALIQAIFFDGLSERAYSEKQGLSPSAIHGRKMKILRKLKRIIES